MKIYLHDGTVHKNVHKVMVYMKVPTPYVEIHWKVEQKSDKDARIITTEPLVNIKKFKND